MSSPEEVLATQRAFLERFQASLAAASQFLMANRDGANPGDHTNGDVKHPAKESSDDEDEKSVDPINDDDEDEKEDRQDSVIGGKRRLGAEEDVDVSTAKCARPNVPLDLSKF